MEESWKNLFSSLEMEEDEQLHCPVNFFDEDQSVQEETDTAAPAGNKRKSCSSDSQKHVVSSPTTYILSFDKSTVHDPYDCFDLNNKATFEDVSAATLSMPSSSTEKNLLALGKKKPRSSSETLYHIMTERKRRQTITEKFIALSAAIPGLKKMNKASVLGEAINYVKQLQNRVRMLEEETAKTSVHSLIVLKKSLLYIDEEGTCSERKCGDCCYKLNEALPEIEARVLKKEVLIRIHCGRQEDILLKILSQLEKHHLTAPKSCVLPFGNTLGITIVAQMGENYRMIVTGLVKDLKLALL